MIIIFFVILGIIIGYLISKNEGWLEFDIVFLNCFIGVAISILISVLLIIGVSLGAETQPYMINKEKIYALGNELNVEGSFFLGIGSINEKMKYYYVVEEQHGKKIDNVKSDNAYIIEDDNETPRIETYEHRIKNDRLRFWFQGFNTMYRVIYVPEDSIKTEFNISL